jgi:hypothetical protein
MISAERLKELPITSWCINNRTSIYIFTILVSISGFLIYNSLPKELYPDVVVPTISVTTIYGGASPQDMRASSPSRWRNSSNRYQVSKNSPVTRCLTSD